MDPLEILNTIDAALCDLKDDASLESLPPDHMLENLVNVLRRVLIENGILDANIRNFVDGLDGACHDIYRGFPSNNLHWNKKLILSHIDELKNLLPRP